MKKLIRSILESDFKLWVVFFLYPFAAALFVQLILLPQLFPQWHAGDGMLAGGDWYELHLLAVSLAEKIHLQGWSAWVLRPEGQAPSGIAAIFYVLLWPHPWVLIPLFAGLHATAALTLFKIVMRLTGNRSISLIATLFFWLYPSAMIWYTQIHKDGFLIAGAFLILLAWLRLGDAVIWKRWRDVLFSLAILFAGAFLAWIVRPYSVQMMQGVSLVIVLLVSYVFARRFWKREWRFWQALAAAGIVWISLVTLTLFTVGGIKAELPLAPIPTTPTTTLSPTIQAKWISSGWPAMVEEKAYALAQVRDGYRLGYPDAGSNIDTLVSYHKISDILLYLPRSAEIAFLSPFPPDWFKPGTLPANTIMRRVSGFEMLGVYLALIFLLYAIWRWRTRLDLWIILIFCCGMTLIYGLVIVNVGTLYRFRYGFIMTLVAVGIASGISFWEDRKKKTKV